MIFKISMWEQNKWDQSRCHFCQYVVALCLWITFAYLVGYSPYKYLHTNVKRNPLYIYVQHMQVQKGNSLRGSHLSRYIICSELPKLLRLALLPKIQSIINICWKFIRDFLCWSPLKQEVKRSCYQNMWVETFRKLRRNTHYKKKLGETITHD